MSELVSRHLKGRFQEVSEFAYLAWVAFALFLLVVFTPMKTMGARGISHASISHASLGKLGSIPQTRCEFQPTDHFNQEKLHCGNVEGSSEAGSAAGTANDRWNHGIFQLINSNSSIGVPGAFID